MINKSNITYENIQLVKNATYASVFVAIVLIVLKYFAWYITGSVSLLSTLLDSLVDLSASVLNLFAVRLAIRPPTKNYTFGHGKFESLSALIQAFFIMGSALFFIREIYQQIFYEEKIQEPYVGVVVMIISIIITTLLLAYQRYVVKKTKSLAISADSIHYFSDLLINACVIVALIGTWYLGWEWIDSAIGICIGIYVLYMAVKITIEPLQVLMDRELNEEEREKIEDLVRSNSDVKGFHDLRTRSAGQNIFIQMHLELDKELSLERAHEISDEVKESIESVFPGAEVLIHQDPV